MYLLLDHSVGSGYKSKSQIARIVTEQWAVQNLFCPVCGSASISRYGANRPVADFYCPQCTSDFELKSKETRKPLDITATTILDGAYSTMLERITSQNNPNLFYMQHNATNVLSMVLIPRFFFTPAIIEKRPPLKETARRAGWVGCNIKLESVPSVGKIQIIKDGVAESAQAVVQEYQRAQALKTGDIEARGWLMDVLLCVEKLGEHFNLSDMYSFESELAQKHPNNNFIQPKIRQQLQVLRNKGLIEFVAPGIYRKL